MAIQGPNTYGSYINEAFKDPRYTAAEKAVSDAQAALDALVTSAPTFQTEEQKRILAADKFLPTFNADRAKQVGQLYARPATARAEYQDIFDPTRRSALVATAVGNVLGQLSGTNEAIAQRKGTATDLAQQAYNALLARIEGQRSSLETAKEKRNTIKSLLEDAAKSFYEEQQYEKRRQQELADNLRLTAARNGPPEQVSVDGFVEAAINASLTDADNFDLGDWAERVPAGQRDAFLQMYNSRAGALLANEAEQQRQMENAPEPSPVTSGDRRLFRRPAPRPGTQFRVGESVTREFSTNPLLLRYRR